MAGIPYYSITSCCDQSTTQGFFTIPGSGSVANGVYVFNGITFLEGSTGMWFYSGFCYTVQYAGTTFGIYPAAFNDVDITTATGNTCESSDCAACGIAILPSFSVYNCCDANNVINLNIDTTDCSGIVDGVWVYEGNGYSTDSGFQFNRGDCYNFTQIEDGVYENGPPCYEYSFWGGSCQDNLSGKCPACDLALQYLTFTSCCTDTVLLFKGIDAASYFGVREYLGTLVNGLENSCYSIKIYAVGDSVVPDVTAYNALPDPPVYIEGVTFSVLSSIETYCDLYTAQCPECNPQCYTLYGCDGQSFNTIIDLSGYLNSFITVIDENESKSGPWFVIENNGTCDNAVNTISVDPITPQPCAPICYDVTGTGKILYIGYDLVLNTAIAPLKFCSYIYPQVDNTALVKEYGECRFTETGLECPPLCFLLTNCADPTITYNSNSQNLINYIGQTVTINGYDGCYAVIVNSGECSCPINVTVLTSYANCTDCLPIIAYKLINCNTPAQVQYTYQDLSAYVGHGVELDCGQCWVVEQIDYAPPSVQVITIAFDFESCQACARTYYKLTDCSGIQQDVYTYTDLSAYVSGNQAIKLKDCDTCWTVEETRLLGFPPTIVSWESTFVDCQECLVNAPCLCSTIRNDQDIPASFEYVDCFGEQQVTPGILPGETSDKICLQRWLNNAEKTNYVKYYGDCTQAGARLSPWSCPPPVYHLRTVKPGYNTPACSAEKYERISCKAAQLLYRNVLELRYGISNCCPEEDQNWLIKKELIDLAALYNPAYPCVPNDPCGCGCGSQGSCGSGCGCGQPDDCSCNQPRSCNS